MARPTTDPTRDRPTLLDHPTRRAIARACRSRPHSITELEKSLCRKGLKGIAENLEAWGVLVVVGKTSRASPKYSLAKSWRADLEAAISRSNSSLFSSQRLVLVEHSDLAGAAACLARQHSDDLAWVGVLGQLDGLLIGVDSSSELSDLQQSLRKAGIECELTVMDEPATGAEIEPYLRGLGAAGDR